MPCNQNNCPDYTPNGDATGLQCGDPCGVQVTKVISPTWDTSRINVPSWNRDRVMYYYNDLCVTPGELLIEGTEGEDPGDGDGIEYGWAKTINPNAGKIRKSITDRNNWWRDQCPEYRNINENLVSPEEVRYWDHYPSEQSFEPIRSDTWFSYIYDTSAGVVGEPCKVRCFFLYNETDSGYRSSFYGIEYFSYPCACDAEETYINYQIEDGKITPEDERDPYPLIWTVGTKDTRIAFKYLQGPIDANIYVKPNYSTLRSISRWVSNDPQFGGDSSHFYTAFPTDEIIVPNSYTLENENYFYIYPETLNTQSITIQDPGGSIVELHRFYNPISRAHLYTLEYEEGANAANYNYEGVIGKVITSTTTPPPASPVVGSIPIYRKFDGDDYLLTTEETEGQYSGYVNEGIAFWAFPPSVASPAWTKVIDKTTGKTNAELSGLGGSRIYVLTGGESFPLPNQRYNTELILKDSSNTVIGYLNSTWRPAQSSGEVVYDISIFNINNFKLPTKESSQISEGTEYTLFVRSEPDQNRLINVGKVKFENLGRISTKKGVASTFHMSEPTQVSATNGVTLSSLGFYEVWNATSTATYMSSQGNNLWKSRNTKVTQDFSLPNGTILRMNISSYWDDTEETYYTRWKIEQVIRYGSNYTIGDGTTYSGQNVYYLYYPSAEATDRVGVAIMISGAQNKESSEGSRKLIPGDTINGWTIDKVKETDDKFNTQVAYIKDGSQNFTKDTEYTSTSGIVVDVKAGWGIPDRAAILGTYEFQRKEIVYITGEANLDVPQEDLDVIKPELQAVVENGKVVEIQILKSGKNLTNPLIEPIKIGVEQPPGYLDKSKYLQLIKDGEYPSVAYKKSRGSVSQAFVEPVFTGGILTSIEIISGGSGYSSTIPPLVSVPYIARRFTTIDVDKSSAKEQEPGVMEMFKSSEAFQILAKTPYSYKKYNLDPNVDLRTYQTTITDPEGLFTTKNQLDLSKVEYTEIQKTGYDAADYINDQENKYSEKVTTELKGSIKTIQRKKNDQIYVKPKSGISKEVAQSFLPPSHPDHVKTKTADHLSLLNSADILGKRTTSYFSSFSQKQTTIISTGNPNTSPTLQENLTQQLSSEQKLELSNTKTFVSKTETENTIEPDDTTSLDYINKIKPISISISNLDEGKYYNKQFKDFYRGAINNPTFSKKIDAGLQQINTITENNINSMWEMDLDDNRTFVYDGSATKVANYGFFNLPCADKNLKYFVQSFCPDQRKNTNLHINVGVKVAGKNLTTAGQERGPCVECLHADSALIAKRNELQNLYGSSVTITLEDAWCELYATYTPFDNPDSLPPGNSNVPKYGIPYGVYELGAGWNWDGFTREEMREHFQNDRVYEGCRDYEFSGNLEILHDRTLETQTFVQAIRRYGNPYESFCSRSYEDVDSIDETRLYNMVAATNQHDSNAVPQLSNPTLFSE